MMEQEAIRFEQKDSDIFVYGYPELKDRKGVIVGDGIAFFFGEGWRNYELYIANTITGKSVSYQLQMVNCWLMIMILSMMP